MALLKGKTIRRMPLVVVQDIVEVPKEIRENHKRVTLTINIFLSTGFPTLSLSVCGFAFFQ